MDITDEYQEAFDFLNTETSGFLFLTGKAGTGKSTFLKVMPDYVNKKFVKVAPTGIAALNISGETIHSFFHFSTQMIFTDEPYNEKVEAKLRGVEMIVIDEISMVRADIMDRIDSSLRVNTGVDLPFGGLIVLAIGDPYQLPPVLTREETSEFRKLYMSEYFISSKIFMSEETEICVQSLTKVFRQSDLEFIELLDKLRENSISDRDIAEVNRKMVIGSVPDNFNGVILCTTNAPAEKLNVVKLQELKTPSFYFYATIRGDVSSSSWPTAQRLELKVGAKVVFCRNGPMYRNGETGIIKSILHGESVEVEKKDGCTVQVTFAKWEFFSYGEGGVASVAGEFIQIPLKLGWALTIHKSQGMTISDEVIIDTGKGCFADGQFYVAASRITDPKNMKLINPLRRSDVRASSLVKYFMEGE
jgi:energy-coupling factor transporter ATP-binding protein EcfA2